MKTKVMLVFGTRPEAIKMAPVVAELKKRSADFIPVVCVTAQHRHMQDQALSVFGIKPDYDLDLMKPGQSLNDIVSRVLQGISEIFAREKPDYVLVQGDTSTAFAAALAAFHAQIAVGHVEAGLRTHQKYAPFPEEINRKMLSTIAEKHFAPTPFAGNVLRREGYVEDSIIVTGNTVIDALFWVLKNTQPAELPELQDIFPEKPIILVTGHRRESFGEGFHDICVGLKMIAEKYPHYHIVYPVHLNPNVQEPVLSLLGGIDNVRLMQPVEYVKFVHLMKRSKFIISDSGGIQEEATALGKPVLVMRDVTERPEGVEAGVCKLVGADAQRIAAEASRLIDDPEAYAGNTTQLFGDGFAARRIVDALKK
ncbi:MAG: UDP-N-acetylglucosamine 2-epimerase (non-hydrolyzing) [Gammaproteobacteria bacterium]|nr:UDP-N-acetylglucosamine 2-epimerase (non-hydrolyzing) [Gammaproteobacteria bacterium]